MKGFVTAIRTLTIIPMIGESEERYASSLVWFPFVGMILGLFLCLIAFLWLEILEINWHSGGAAIILLGEILLTRGIHVDGLADWADAIGSHSNIDRRLTIMKDSRLGAFGSLAVVMDLLLKWVALERLLYSGSFLGLLFILIITRGMMVELITTIPYARSGEGMAGPFIKDASSIHKLWTRLITMVLCLGWGPAGLVLFAAGWVTTGLLGLSFRKYFGGITGDLLGASNEITGSLLLILCALPGKSILCYTGWSWIFI